MTNDNSEIIFKNGSIISGLTEEKYSLRKRSRRADEIRLFCSVCKEFKKEIAIINENSLGDIIICKDCFNDILSPYMAKKE